LTTTTNLTEKVWRVVRVRGGKIKRGKSAGRKGFRIKKGGKGIVKITAAKARRKSQRLRSAAKRLRGKRASIQRKAKRSKKLGSRIRRRKF
jgi:hypothetical protein